MAGSVLVDTNVVVAYFRGDKVLHPHFQNATEIYGHVKVELAQLGKPIPDNDLRIAAMARKYDLPLATRDARFTQVPRLKTLAW